jgi:hypothetical protein
MRNLGLALLLASFLLAPHLADAKKKHAQKHSQKGRPAKALKLRPFKAKRARADRPAPPPRDDDELASAVAVTRRSPVVTAVAPAAAPAMPNEPLNMANQVNDDEVPGHKKK